MNIDSLFLDLLEKYKKMKSTLIHQDMKRAVDLLNLENEIKFRKTQFLMWHSWERGKYED